jgi:hypothetical protein
MAPTLSEIKEESEGREEKRKLQSQPGATADRMMAGKKIQSMDGRREIWGLKGRDVDTLNVARARGAAELGVADNSHFVNSSHKTFHFNFVHICTT